MAAETARAPAVKGRPVATLRNTRVNGYGKQNSSTVRQHAQTSEEYLTGGMHSKANLMRRYSNRALKDKQKPERVQNESRFQRWGSASHESLGRCPG